MTAFLIPTILIFINRVKSKVHPQDSEVDEEGDEKLNTVSKEVQTDQAEEFGRPDETPRGDFDENAQL